MPAALASLCRHRRPLSDPPRRWGSLLLLPSLLTLASACRDSAPALGPSSPQPVAVVLAGFYSGGWSSDAYLATGDTATLHAQAYAGSWPERVVHDSERSAADARRFRWISSDTLVAAVDSGGLVTVRRPGTTVLAAEIDGVRGDGPLLHVYPRVASITVEAASDAAGGTVEIGGANALRVTARNAAGEALLGVPFNVWSTDANVAGPAGSPPRRIVDGGTTEIALYAWRGGTTQISAMLEHERPADRLSARTSVTVRDPGVAPDTLRRRTTGDPALRIEIGRSLLRAGDTTTVRLVLRNITTATERFTWSANCVLAFRLFDASGRYAWPLRTTRAVPDPCGPPTAYTLAPGDSLVRTIPWRADDGSESPTVLVPGFYVLHASARGDRADGSAYQIIGRDGLVIRVLP